MAQKKEVIFPLVVGLLAIGLIGGCFGFLWWLVNSGSPAPFESLLQPGESQSEGAGADSSLKEAGAPLTTSKDVPAGLFNYGGSTTMIPIRELLEPSIAQSFPDFQLRYTSPIGKSPGSGTGIQMLLDGQLAFSESSRSLKANEYETAQQLGFLLTQIPVAIDGIAVAIHPELDIPGLTVEQLRLIYLGQLTNWSELGGPNLAITPFSRSVQAGGTPEFFSENVLQGDDFGAVVTIVETTTMGLQSVAETPGSLYYASAPEVVPQCAVKPLALANIPGSEYVAPYQDPWVPNADCPDRRNQVNAEAFRSGDYPLTRRLFVIVKVDGSDDELAGQAYADLLLSEAGQALVEQAGFVSIR